MLLMNCFELYVIKLIFSFVIYKNNGNVNICLFILYEFLGFFMNRIGFVNLYLFFLIILLWLIICGFLLRDFIFIILFLL